MKKIKKMLALVLAMALVLGTMTIPAMAAVPTNGSITVNSPVVGATYKVYKVFNMTTNEAVDAFSYTIDTNSPFYAAVKAYADVAANKLKLTPIAAEHVDDVATTDTDESYDKFNVSTETGFDAQAFGKAMQAVLAGSPAVADDPATPENEAQAEVPAITPVATKVAGVADSAKITFTGLDLGYFLINPTYPAAAYGTVTMGSGENKKTFTTDALEKDADGNIVKPLALTDAAKDETDAYATATVTDEYVDQYIADHKITTNKDGKPLDAAGKAEYKDDLLAKMKEDAQKQVLDAFATSLAASEADVNVKEPIMVFLDSSQPNATINEKNELDKWDVPVNPTADTQPGTPDHGEPDGGKNIVVQENPAYYADWSEAEIGESVHYQLRVNAMNFIRADLTDDNKDNETVNQVKQYFLADYQSGHMHLDESPGKGIQVSVWAGNDSNDSQNGMTNVTKDANGQTVAAGYIDYTSKKASFFKNTSDEDAASKPTDIFGEGTGIMVPWVKISEKNPTAPDPAYPIYTTTQIATGEYLQPTQADVQAGKYVVDNEGYALDKDNQRIPLYDTYYVYSLYNSDVTIVVDYWMILDDDAIVDEPGNKNYAQYGWSPVDTDEGTGVPKTPSDTDKPSQKEEVDEATVYTFALAWVKTDEKGKQLAGAKFQLPFYVKKTKDVDAYVYAFETLPETFATGDSDDNYTNEVVTTADDAVITIKGVEQGVYSITETEAPEGYNKLAEPFNVEAKKSGDGVTTKTKTTIYLDEKGNVVKEETSTTTEYNTDKDTYSNETATGDAKDRVPVYQFDPIVNQKGTELPSTGGIGTTIFYVMGSILVICAGVVLVTRRRMSA